MSNEELKSENYTNFGGMNAKQSAYILGPTEFLDLTNYDFQVPGALSPRWGSTMYVGQTFSSPVNSIYEYSRLNGNSYVIIGASGQLWSGATTGQSQGLSMTFQGVTSIITAFFGSILSTNSGPPNVLNIQALPINYQDNPAMVLNKNRGEATGTGVTTIINAQLVASSRMSYTTFQDYLFMADGQVFQKYNGITTSFLGLPPATWQGSASVTFSSSPTLIGLAINQSLGFYVYGSYVDQRGFEGPIWPFCSISTSGLNGTTASSLGGTFAVVNLSINTPLQYDIASINLYSFALGISLVPFFIGNASFPLWARPYTFMGNTPASGSTFTLVPIGTGPDNGAQQLINTNGGNFPSVNTTYSPLGLTLVVGTGATNTLVTQIDMASYAPRFLDVYENQLFAAGFSNTPSTVWFSAIGEPEGFAPTNNFQVRTNDADTISCIRAYFTSLYIFKHNSFHVLTGDNPLNFVLQQVSLVYGCMNNQCAVVFNDMLAFLDSKGVVLYNGSTPTLISMKMQPYFDRMNYTAALSTAKMVHDKLRSQLLIAIPIDGSTAPNITLVYDYLVGAWTKQNGYSPTAFSEVRGRNNSKNVFYGTTTGAVNWFGPSFLSDNGAGFTLYAKSRFHHEIGESYEKQFRRLYLNLDLPSATFTMTMNLYQDFGQTAVTGTTNQFQVGEFQTRIDYGVAARALAFDISYVQTAEKFNLYGYTITERLQRKK